MDELFREAATGYPLKTDNCDWDGLASRLLHTPVTPVPVKKKKKNNFNKYGPASLLVIVMLVLGGMPYTSKKNETKIASHLPGTGYVEKKGKGAVLTEHNTINASQQLPFNTEPTGKKAKTQELVNNDVFTIGYDQARKTKPGAAQITNTISSINEHNKHAVPATAALDLSYNTGKAATANKPISAGRLLLNRSIDTAALPAMSRKRNIYWGIVFGPAISRVKNQELGKTGFGIGVLAGISVFKGNAFVETGLLYTQKYYYSDGKYFKAAMQPGMEVMSLKGSSRLFEVPVMFKYKVFEKRRTTSFLSAGISSYMMTGEENNYNIMMNGVEQSMLGTYKDKSRYFAVMANIGAEYNYAIGKHTRIRIGPYIQIPLKGIGIGSMPVMTAGLHIGLMRFTP